MIRGHVSNVPGGRVLVFWDTESDKFVRGFVTKKTAQAFREQMISVLGDEVKSWNIFGFFSNADIPSLASSIPGIHQKVIHPVTKSQGQLYHIIQDLNDSHGWSREKIADWIETLDNPPKFKPPKSQEDLAEDVYALEKKAPGNYKASKQIVIKAEAEW